MNILERALRVMSVTMCVDCGLEGSTLCAVCYQQYQNTAISACYRCNSLTHDFRTCSACMRRTALAAVFVACEYEPSIRSLIHAFKFKQERHQAEVLSKLLLEILPFYSRGELVIVPVPTASSRVRQRGFDHAVVLAKRVASHRGLEYEAALVSMRQSQQVGARRKDRFIQMESAFRVRSPAAISGRTVCIVDDVSTTGATLEAASAVLKAAGAKRVIALVVARGS